MKGIGVRVEDLVDIFGDEFEDDDLSKSDLKGNKWGSWISRSIPVDNKEYRTVDTGVRELLYFPIIGFASDDIRKKDGITVICRI